MQGGKLESQTLQYFWVQGNFELIFTIISIIIKSCWFLVLCQNNYSSQILYRIANHISFSERINFITIMQKKSGHPCLWASVYSDVVSPPHSPVFSEMDVRRRNTEEEQRLIPSGSDGGTGLLSCFLHLLSHQKRLLNFCYESGRRKTKAKPVFNTWWGCNVFNNSRDSGSKSPSHSSQVQRTLKTNGF